MKWTKLPSVTRPGKYFYRGQHNNGTTYTLLQSFLTGLWGIRVGISSVAPGEFKTANDAMRQVENFK